MSKWYWMLEIPSIWKQIILNTDLPVLLRGKAQETILGLQDTELYSNIGC